MGLKETYRLGMDIGSGSLKCFIVRGDGTVLGAGSKELITYYAFPGWSEQNPEDWYQAFCEPLEKP